MQLRVVAALWLSAASATADAGGALWVDASTGSETVVVQPAATSSPSLAQSAQPQSAQPQSAQTQSAQTQSAQTQSAQTQSAQPPREPLPLDQPHGAAPDAPVQPGVPVQLGGREVYSVRVPRAGKSAQERAHQATRTLSAVLDDPEAGSINILRQGPLVVLRVGETQILSLGEADAQAAGDDSLDAHAGSVVAVLRRALQAERERSKVAKGVFSVSILVFLGLFLLFAMRKFGKLIDRGQLWVETHPDSLTLRVRDVDLLTAATVRSAALVALVVGRRLGQLSLVYAWLVAALSMFESTRGMTQQLTGWVVAPLYQLTTRVATTLPLLLVFTIAGTALWILLQFIRLSFASIARGETRSSWVPQDLARPVSLLLQVGIVLLGAVLGAPLVTGNAEGALPRLGGLGLFIVGLASTPLLASAVVGAVTLFSRKLSLGDCVRINAWEGRVITIDLLEIGLETAGGTLVHIPQLVLLRAPVEHLGSRYTSAVEIALDAKPGPRACEVVLREVAALYGEDVQVALTRATSTTLRFSVSARPSELNAPSLLSQLVEDLPPRGLALSTEPSLSTQPSFEGNARTTR